jgi:hypothetical protein
MAAVVVVPAIVIEAKAPAVNTKKCNKCQEVKPVTSFWENKARCKQCMNAATRQRRKRKRDNAEFQAKAKAVEEKDGPEAGRVCIKCGQFKKWKEYYRDLDNLLDFHRRACKTCMDVNTKTVRAKKKQKK